MGCKLLIIAGPTGVGKTELVLKLAQKKRIEIINGDIGQMYTPLTIGTAKPNWRNEPVPHHLFDILNSPENFSIIRFREMVTKLVDEIWARGALPVIVGGSTMYIKSLFWLPGAEDGCDKHIEITADNLWEKLNQIDPVRAAALHPNDTYRLQRALAIWQKTGKRPSECALKYQPVVEDSCLIILNRAKDDLYQRIDARVVEMIKEGWVEEVASLDSEWREFLRFKKIIGYETIIEYLEDQILLSDAISKIQQRVRNYAKRQQTFWRGLQRELQGVMQESVFEIDLTLLEVDLYLNRILQKLELD